MQLKKIRMTKKEGVDILALFEGRLNLHKSLPNIYTEDTWNDGLLIEGKAGQYPSKTDAEFGVVKKLLYETSWDWQIPVWKKVNNKVNTIISKMIEDEKNNYMKILTKMAILKNKYSDAVVNDNKEEGFYILLDTVMLYSTIN